jgi:hypothetical protein
VQLCAGFILDKELASFFLIKAIDGISGNILVVTARILKLFKTISFARGTCFAIQYM